jgi:predicted secreted protein
LNLTLSSAIPAPSVICIDTTQAKKIKLEITNNQTTSTSILRVDALLPTSRGCAHNYEIREVVVVQSNVLVLLRVYSNGLEGEDVRYMAVSGVLK